MNLPPLPKPLVWTGCVPGPGAFTADQLRAYATRAVLAEREACAEICVALNRCLGEVCADSIRARNDD